MNKPFSLELDNSLSVEQHNELAVELHNELKVKRFNSIYEIDRTCWDSLIDNIFQSYDFLRVIETADIEQSKLYYLLFYAEEKVVGSAVLSTFDVSLDLLAGESFQKFVKTVRNFYSSFFRIRFLFCGTPISIGKNNICLKDNAYRQDFIKLLSREMSYIAMNENIKIQCVKELIEKEANEFYGFCQYKFLLADTIPYMRLDIYWKDFKSYINDMRSGYRRQVKEGLKKTGVKEPPIYAKDNIKPCHPYLLLTPASESSPDRFYSLYLQVMNRQKNKLEILNKRFFENFFNNMHPEAELLSLVDKDEIYGAALLTQVKDKMTFLLIGFDYTKNRVYDTYFNIVYGIIALAIKRKCRILEMGQTSYYFKQRCGAIPTDIFMYIKSDNKFIQILLKAFRKFLFPRIKLPAYNVFKPA